MITAQIEQIFDDLICQLITRKEALLRKVHQLQEDFVNKEASRLAAMEELERAQARLREMNLKVNANIGVHDHARRVYEQAKHQHATPTRLRKLTFFHPTLSRLCSEIAEFGVVVEALNYSEKVQPILTAGRRGSGDKELSGRAVALDEDSQTVYVADYDNSRIQVLSFQGEFLSQFGSEVLQGPCGIGVTDCHIFVADFHLHTLLQFCKDSHKLLDRVSGKGKDEGHLMQPHMLAIDTNGDIYIVDGNHRVSIFSEQLQFNSIVGEKYLHNPRDVKLTSEEVIVLDRGPKCIHFFSRSGEFLSSCVTQGQGNCSIQICFFFCLDTEQNIIIGDRGNQTVNIFSKSGDLIHIIGGKGGGKGDFIKPCGIAISNSGILFVLSNNTNYSLQCF